MTARRLLDAVLQQDAINFALTNRIPRRLLTRFVGWFSAIEQPLVRDASIGVWSLFAGDLELDEAESQEFASLHACFTRKLKQGARPIDPRAEILVSPCDAIVGAHGRMDGVDVVQAKGHTYSLDELLVDRAIASRYRNGSFVTLRLTSSMYHRFHAPFDCDVVSVHHVPGDMWNVNPAAVARVPRLFCRNERVVLDLRLRGSEAPVTLVAVGAILVASICLNFVETPFDQRYCGPRRLACRASFRRGDEIGYFRHGSTILVFAGDGVAIHPDVVQGRRIRMGTPLLTSSIVPAQTGTR